MLKKTIILCCFVALAITANAQFSVGLRAGFNASTIMGNDGDGVDKNYKPGFHAGVAVQYMFTEAAGIESGLYYSMLGVKNKYKNGGEEGDSKITMNPSYIQLPLAFIYKFNVGQDLYLYPSVGVYAGYGVGGKIKGDEGDGIDFFGKTDLGELGKIEQMNRFDMGGTVGLNLQYSKFTIGLGYDYGFLKVNKEDLDGNLDDMKNGNIKVSLGYFF